MNFKTSLPVIAGAVAGGAVALAVSGGGGTTTRTVTSTIFAGGGSASAPARGVPTGLTRSGGLSINQIYRQASPGVVDITVTSTTQSGPSLFFGNGGSQQTQGEGAGVVYDKQGDILTDEHVVANATSVKVHFQDGYTATAKVLGTDPSTDVAVIKVEVPASELHPIPFADSSTSQVGDEVVAIGSPFSLPETTTAGIVSAVGRSITAPNNYTITGAIQTDAAINPGNSGGPLLDASGHVLGLNDQIQTQSGDSAGVGFATPANTDVRIAQQIISGKSVKHAYVGVCLNPNSTGGAQIALRSDPLCPVPVVVGSPAATSGLQPGDVITAINGTKVAGTNAFIATIANYAPGRTVTLTIIRDGRTFKRSLTLGDRPQTAPTG